MNDIENATGGTTSLASDDSLLEVRPDPDLQDLIPSFMDNRRQEWVELDKAAAARDFALIRRTAHTWKGICRPYGFIHLEALSRRLEKAGEAENQAEVQSILLSIKDHLDRVRIIYNQ